MAKLDTGRVGCVYLGTFLVLVAWIALMVTLMAVGK